MGYYLWIFHCWSMAKHINKISTVKALRKDLKLTLIQFYLLILIIHTYQSIIPSHDCLFVAIIHFLSNKY